MSQTLAFKLLQLVALAIPPVVVLIKLLRKSDNLSWTVRKWGFALAIASVVMFIFSGVSLVVFFLTTMQLPMTIQLALGLTLLGLLPFAAFTGILYREHKLAFGP